MATTAPTPTRTFNGVQLPAPGTWTVDRDHAEIGFVGRHFMFTKVRGRFTGVDAKVEIGEDPTVTRVTAVIDMASVDSGSAVRDEHLRSEDLFDVASFPKAIFESTEVTWNGTAGTVVGDLTLHGITRPVTLDVEFHGAGVDPWENQRAVFEAHGRVDRTDWGLTWNMALESGGLLVSTAIDLEFHIELMRDAG